MDSDDEDDEVLSKTDVSGVRRLQISDHLKTALKQSKPEVLPERIVQKMWVDQFIADIVLNV